MGRSIRARLALWASVAMALLCLTTGAALVWVGHDTAFEIRTREVTGASRRPIHLIRDNELTPAINVPLKGAQVVDPSGRVVASTPGLAGSPRLSQVTPDPV
ncbi:hypothetical protein AB0J09_43240, partial [Nonomuraea sp. NPDC049784]